MERYKYTSFYGLKPNLNANPSGNLYEFERLSDVILLEADKKQVGIDIATGKKVDILPLGIGPNGLYYAGNLRKHYFGVFYNIETYTKRYMTFAEPTTVYYSALINDRYCSKALNINLAEDRNLINSYLDRYQDKEERINQILRMKHQVCEYYNLYQSRTPQDIDQIDETERRIRQRIS